ncbi:MAG TPA: hypothetical protein VJU77_01265 [Chthoniobacterales bacterium]|nr:hypothetical protein [Chthoniobacterales bacterium]
MGRLKYLSAWIEDRYDFSGEPEGRIIVSAVEESDAGKLQLLGDEAGRDRIRGVPSMD